MTENFQLNQILKSLTTKNTTADIWQALETLTLADKQRAKAFNISNNNVTKEVRRRGELFQIIYPEIEQTNIAANINNTLETLWNLWLPLALQLADNRQALNRPLIQGILGGQGTGKTTLAAILKLILLHLGYTVLTLSLDDLYKTFADRQRLQQQDRRLIWRGPPGTHDIDLGIAVLDQLRQPLLVPVAVPRFDKSACGGAGDRTNPEIIAGADIVLFEGWFVGAMPINSPDIFDRAPAPILTESDRLFARDMNDALRDYLPLWQRLDRLMVLYPVDYRLSVQWRRQAEQKMRASGKSGMSDAEIEDFVKYFWKALHPELFIKPLVNNPEWVDLVIEVKADHSAGAVYSP